MPEQQDSPYGPPTHEVRIGAGLPFAPPPRRRNRLKVTMITLWVTAAVIAAGAGGYFLLRPEATMTVSGTLSLTDPSGIDWGTPDEPRANCIGEGGYDDIAAGASVVIRDGGGKTVAVGHLEPGTTVMDKDLAIATQCDFPFTVNNVPDGSDFYSIEVTHRGPVNYPHDRLASGGVQITLGG